MRTALILPVLLVAACALFLRSYTLPPAPDRRGGTTLLLTWPDRPAFGSPGPTASPGRPTNRSCPA
ncbi:hypothetical protein ACU4GA_12355 [Methylobacterium oryzae CBMB20]